MKTHSQHTATDELPESELIAIDMANEKETSTRLRKLLHEEATQDHSSEEVETTKSESNQNEASETILSAQDETAKEFTLPPAISKNTGNDQQAPAGRGRHAPKSQQPKETSTGEQRPAEAAPTQFTPSKLNLLLAQLESNSRHTRSVEQLYKIALGAVFLAVLLNAICLLAIIVHTSSHSTSTNSSQMQKSLQDTEENVVPLSVNGPQHASSDTSERRSFEIDISFPLVSFGSTKTWSPRPAAPSWIHDLRKAWGEDDDDGDGIPNADDEDSPGSIIGYDNGLPVYSK